MGVAESLNLAKGHSDYMPPSFVTEALKQAACNSSQLVHRYTPDYVSIETRLALFKCSLCT